jgi:hypothetical protein
VYGGEKAEVRMAIMNISAPTTPVFKPITALAHNRHLFPPHPEQLSPEKANKIDPKYEAQKK